MNKGVRFGIIFLLFAIVGIAIIDAGAKRPINWSKNYSFTEKSPYGFYVFREEIQNILGGERTVSNFGESLYEMLDSLQATDVSELAIVDIYGYSHIDDLDASYLLDFVSRGGEVFLSRLQFGRDLLDSLGIKAQTLSYVNFQPSAENVSYSLLGDTTLLKLKRVDEFRVFSKLNQACTILGYLHSKGHTLPNFIKVKYGKGYFYLYTLPEAFANYHLLEKESYDYAARMLNMIQHRDLLLHDYYYEDHVPNTPLRVILTQPGFAEAWYILLFCLLVLLVFKSKREQRAVEVVYGEPNLSREFAKTIANVYYENGDAANILHKKIEYFLFAIRSAYHLETMDLLNEKFIFQLSAKSMVSVEETYSLMELLAECKARQNFSIADVKMINNKIEEFKIKANL